MRECHARALRLPNGLIITSRVAGTIQVLRAWNLPERKFERTVYRPKDRTEVVVECGVVS